MSDFKSLIEKNIFPSSFLQISNVHLPLGHVYQPDVFRKGVNIFCAHDGYFCLLAEVSPIAHAPSRRLHRQTLLKTRDSGTAHELPHREKYLLLVFAFVRRLLDFRLELIDEVSATSRGTRRR